MRRASLIPKPAFLIAAGLALGLAAPLAACGRTPQADPVEFPTEGEQKVDIGVAEGLPQWLQVAHQRGGGSIHWDHTSLTRYPGGEASVWVRSRFDQPQLFEAESETSETAVRYQIEHVHYRFKCDSRQFAILERRFIGNADRILGSVPYDEPIYRPVIEGTVAGVMMPIACRGR